MTSRDERRRDGRRARAAERGRADGAAAVGPRGVLHWGKAGAAKAGWAGAGGAGGELAGPRESQGTRPADSIRRKGAGARGEDGREGMAPEWETPAQGSASRRDQGLRAPRADGGRSLDMSRVGHLRTGGGGRAPRPEEAKWGASPDSPTLATAAGSRASWCRPTPGYWGHDPAAHRSRETETAPSTAARGMWCTGGLGRGHPRQGTRTWKTLPSLPVALRAPNRQARVLPDWMPLPPPPPF